MLQIATILFGIYSTWQGAKQLTFGDKKDPTLPSPAVSIALIIIGVMIISFGLFFYPIDFATP